ncbi:MAG: hypothetical protein U0I89_03260 [Prevotella sp.]|jgi:predicted CopG family antitoxin|nr:hypothetical protein [Prevotella sp.]MEE0336297.1 hypothetical protein [Prevotella sp.]
MKKLVITLVLSCLFAVNSMAQEIYKEVVNMKADVERVMNDTTLNIETRKIACFKNDALYYLLERASEEEMFSEYLLGSQANAMIDFVNLYVKRLAAEKKKKNKDIIMATFKNASTANPLFDDPDKELVYGYVDNDKYITQFSIDTDWEKALKAVK